MPLLLIVACQAAQTASPQDFQREEEQWRTQRRTRLLSDDGWLTLVGLFWLQPGVNDVTLPAHPPGVPRAVALRHDRPDRVRWHSRERR